MCEESPGDTPRILEQAVARREIGWLDINADFPVPTVTEGTNLGRELLRKL